MSHKYVLHFVLFQTLSGYHVTNSDIVIQRRDELRIPIFQSFASTISPFFSKVAEFAKQIPGFLELKYTDKLTLIKRGCFEIWVLHVSRMNRRLLLDNSFVICEEKRITRQEMTAMFDVSIFWLIIGKHFHKQLIYAADVTSSIHLLV